MNRMRNIWHLEVSMIDALLVAIADTINQLLKEPPCFLLREFSLTGLFSCSKESNRGIQMPIIEVTAWEKESILNTGGRTHRWEE